MADQLKRRRVELLSELYKGQREGDGRLHTAAMALGRTSGGPVFDFDKAQLIEDGAIGQADMPALGRLGVSELYKVTPEGAQILREWGYL
jgi:hypothetical protein